MFQQRNISKALRGPGGLSAVALLAVAAVLIYANLVWAQQGSTEATLPAPAVTGAERYELWVWTSADGWQQVGRRQPERNAYGCCNRDDLATLPSARMNVADGTST